MQFDMNSLTGLWFCSFRIQGAHCFNVASFLHHLMIRMATLVAQVPWFSVTNPLEINSDVHVKKGTSGQL